jgi:hypothetical protein
VHLTSCHDNDLALCGQDLTGFAWSDDGLGCVVCRDLDVAKVCSCHD